ncbi:nucleoid-associated protein [Cellulosilyticum sp. ST5]|uniref:nucleoid-associated protein n=1 Tax=Cellulosilyticum sp. ST5 TaxID=3055805 RepID=UPI003977CC02
MNDMRDLSNIRIVKAIVHILNNKDDELVLNDFELDINPIVARLFENHIKNSITDETTRVALFNEQSVNQVKDLSNQILSEPDSFIEDSKQIANCLFLAMRNNLRIASANFVVCEYSANNNTYLALLKMDFSEIIETHVEVIEGKNKIVLEIKGSGIPNDKQKLHKCAFIKKSSDENEYDIILLDKDTKEEGIANFFANAFLNCNLIHTNRTNTKGLFINTEKFVNALYRTEPLTAQNKIEVLVHTLQYHKELNVVALAEQLFPDEQIKDNYLQMISKKVGDYTFDVDEQFVKEQISRKNIKTDSGIDIKVALEVFEDKDQFEIEPVGDSGRVNIIIKNVFFTEKTSK